MTGPGGPPVARLGLLVNPIAGIGGAVGLKGSDGPVMVRRALALGAVPRAADRATAALVRLLERWPADRERPVVLAAPGPMGEASARAAGFAPIVVGGLPPAAARPGGTTADDTRRLAAAIVASGVDLLLVAGGDGTARDLCAALPPGVAVLGVPAGVRIHSAVFATSPSAAGELAAEFLATPAERRRTAFREVMDLDEDAYRRGEVAAHLHGELLVPAEARRLQARKSPSPASDADAAAAIADEVAGALVAGRRYVLGPGSTVRAVAERLGIPKTLVGVDVVEADAVEGGRAHVHTADVGDRDLLRIALEAPTVLVVTPIGGQGFILGRGNQQLSPTVVRAILERLGRDGIVVVATPAKLASLRGRPLLVDSGDPALDAELAGHLTVITGRGERSIYPVAPA